MSWVNDQNAVRVILRVVTMLAAVSLQAVCADRAGAAFQYRSVPFAVGGVPTALAESYDEDDLWVGRQGAVIHVRGRPDGAMDPVEAIELPPSVVPIAIAESSPWTFVLDGAGAVLVYSRPHSGHRRLVTTLATGSQPAAMVTNGGFFAIANAGSNDVSLYALPDSGESFPAERRLGVGAQPRALLIGSSSTARIWPSQTPARAR